MTERADTSFSTGLRYSWEDTAAVEGSGGQDEDRIRETVDTGWQIHILWLYPFMVDCKPRSRSGSRWQDPHCMVDWSYWGGKKVCKPAGKVVNVKLDEHASDSNAASGMVLFPWLFCFLRM